MDTLNPGLAWRKREDQTVARKTYSEEFRRDAVELYRSTPGATVVGIAADLEIMDATLSTWLKAAGVPVRGRQLDSPVDPPPGGETPARELARLRGRIAELEASERKLNSERDILRAAAKYFAGETRW
ncbi:transposase [Modestobacter sp. DSM 44400]|nr:transposase [Modestobacter sp. DSM 44400]